MPRRPAPLSVLLLAGLAGSAVVGTALGTTDDPGPERPRDPFVFRCVLDENARMVVVALDPDLTLAFDARVGGLALAWDGEVKLQGAVYDTNHGPQPVHEGEPRLVAGDGPAWMLVTVGGNEVAADVRWLGYRLDGNTVHLRYRLTEPSSGEQVTVVETPEIRRDASGAVVLERRFRTESATGSLGVLLVGPRRAGTAESADAPAAPLDTDGAPPRRHADGSLLVPLRADDATIVRIPLPG